MNFILIFVVFVLQVAFGCDYHDLGEWGKSLASNLYTFDAANYNSQLANNKKLFEPELWSKYIDDFQASDYPNAITKNNLKISNF